MNLSGLLKSTCIVIYDNRFVTNRYGTSQCNVLIFLFAKL